MTPLDTDFHGTTFLLDLTSSEMGTFKNKHSAYACCITDAASAQGELHPKYPSPGHRRALTTRKRRLRMMLVSLRFPQVDTTQLETGEAIREKTNKRSSNYTPPRLCASAGDFFHFIPPRCGHGSRRQTRGGIPRRIRPGLMSGSYASGRDRNGDCAA